MEAFKYPLSKVENTKALKFNYIDDLVKVF